MKSAARLNGIRALDHEPAKVIDARRSGSSTDVDEARALLRKAVVDCGCTFERLEQETGKDRSYLHRVLNGPDRVTLDFITSLPDDVEARFEQLRAEGFGLIVVAPVEGADAVRNLVSGIVGVLRGKVSA